MAVDFIERNKDGATPHGDVASYLIANGGDIRELRTNSVLRKDEQIQMDEAILLANRSRLVGVADLKARGLTFDLGDPLAVMQFEYEKMSKMGRAQVSMDGEAQGRRDRLTFSLGYLPIPIIHQDYSINARVLRASRARKSKLDTTTGEEAGRTVAEELEIMLFQGASSFKFGDGIIYGYTDHPQRCLGSFTDWASGSSPDPVANVRTMKQALIAKGFYGPYALYMPTEFETVLDADYVPGQPSKTIRQRIMDIGKVEIVSVADYMPAGQLVMVQLSTNVVRMVGGLPLQNIEWKTGAGMRTNFLVLTIDVPQIRTDKNNNCGVAHYTAA